MKKLINISNVSKIPTQSPLDQILNGGIEKGSITQFFGPPGSGKTNIVLSAACEVAKNGKKVVFMDTEGGISVERIKQMVSFDFDEIAQNIIVFEPTSFQEQGDNLAIIDSWLSTNKEEIDLLILDSAVALYRVNDMVSSKLNKDLGKQMSLLSKLARKYNVAVVVTNQIYSTFDDEGIESKNAVGGTILQYWSKVIIELEKTDILGQRIAILHRHRTLPEGMTANFKITNNGIE